MGLNMARLLGEYWKKQRIVPKAGKFLGHPFSTGCYIMQVNPASPMIFNIVVGVVVRAILEEVCRTQKVNHKMGWVVRKSNIVLYADD